LSSSRCLAFASKVLIFGGIKLVSIQHGYIKNQNRKSNIQTSDEKNKRILISRVMETTPIDPVAFFLASKRLYEGERTYWSNPTNTNILVGIGRAFDINVNNSEDRFKEVETKWKNLTQDMRVDQHSPYGTGPILFGGFSFDPLREKTELWSDFSDATFILPSILLSVIDGKSYITYNKLDVHNDFTALEQLKEEIVSEITETIETTTPQDYLKSEVDPKRWMDSVAEVTADIRKGQISKVVLAREIELKFKDKIMTENVLLNLKEEQPMSYLFAFESGQSCFIGASPERLVKKKGDEIKSTCLAGSIARGTTLDEDEELGRQLLMDEKNIFEHEVVVSMIKAEMQEACETILSPDSPQLLKMRDIQHLYTPISGTAKSKVTLLSMVQKLHPTPALGGFPKEAALDKIRKVELLDRGWYASPIGWFDVRDNGEFAVAIRSGLLKGNEASLFAGCGIVSDSKPESEYNETNIKFKPMLTALGGMNDGK
jgi:menaquinone-specific isochorismate synthase